MSSRVSFADPGAERQIGILSRSSAGIGSPRLSAAIVQFSTCSTRRETIAVTAADTSESAMLPIPGTGRVRSCLRRLVITTSQ